MDKRDLLDSDGENRAVRAFLQLYDGGKSVTTQRMRGHLAASGFEDHWPDWTIQDGHLTAGGAQAWIRHLFAREVVSPAAELTDEEIFRAFDTEGLPLVVMERADKRAALRAVRALLARSPAQPEWALKQKWYNEGYNDGKELAPAPEQKAASNAYERCPHPECGRFKDRAGWGCRAERDGACVKDEQKAAQPATVPNERDFSEWLNAHRDAHVSSVFHDIVGRYRAAIAALPPVRPESKDAEQAAMYRLLRDEAYEAVIPHGRTLNGSRTAWITKFHTGKTFDDAIRAAIAASQSKGDGK